jgi:hypothetical protein
MHRSVFLHYLPRQNYVRANRGDVLLHLQHLSPAACRCISLLHSTAHNREAKQQENGRKITERAKREEEHHQAPARPHSVSALHVSQKPQANEPADRTKPPRNTPDQTHARADYGPASSSTATSPNFADRLRAQFVSDPSLSFLPRPLPAALVCQMAESVDARNEQDRSLWNAIREKIIIPICENQTTVGGTEPIKFTLAEPFEAPHLTRLYRACGRNKDGKLALRLYQSFTQPALRNALEQASSSSFEEMAEEEDDSDLLQRPPPFISPNWIAGFDPLFYALASARLHPECVAAFELLCECRDASDLQTMRKIGIEPTGGSEAETGPTLLESCFRFKDSHSLSSLLFSFWEADKPAHMLHLYTCILAEETTEAMIKVAKKRREQQPQQELSGVSPPARTPAAPVRIFESIPVRRPSPVSSLLSFSYDRLLRCVFSLSVGRLRPVLEQFVFTSSQRKTAKHSMQTGEMVPLSWVAATMPNAASIYQLRQAHESASIWGALTQWKQGLASFAVTTLVSQSPFALRRSMFEVCIQGFLRNGGRPVYALAWFAHLWNRSCYPTDGSYLPIDPTAGENFSSSSRSLRRVSDSLQQYPPTDLVPLHSDTFTLGLMTLLRATSAFSLTVHAYQVEKSRRQKKNQDSFQLDVTVQSPYAMLRFIMEQKRIHTRLLSSQSPKSLSPSVFNWVDWFALWNQLDRTRRELEEEHRFYSNNNTALPIAPQIILEYWKSYELLTQQVRLAAAEFGVRYGYVGVLHSSALPSSSPSAFSSRCVLSIHFPSTLFPLNASAGPLRWNVADHLQMGMIAVAEILKQAAERAERKGKNENGSETEQKLADLIPESDLGSVSVAFTFSAAPPSVRPQSVPSVIPADASVKRRWWILNSAPPNTEGESRRDIGSWYAAVAETVKDRLKKQFRMVGLEQKIRPVDIPKRIMEDRPLGSEHAGSPLVSYPVAIVIPAQKLREWARNAFRISPYYWERDRHGIFDPARKSPTAEGQDELLQSEDLPALHDPDAADVNYSDHVFYLHHKSRFIRKNKSHLLRHPQFSPKADLENQIEQWNTIIQIMKTDAQKGEIFKKQEERDSEWNRRRLAVDRTTGNP